MLASPPLPTGSAVVDELGALTRDYRTAFLRYLPRHDETALAAAYDLGRRAVATGVSLLDILSIHHTVLAEILHDSPDEMATSCPRRPRSSPMPSRRMTWLHAPPSTTVKWKSRATSGQDG